LLDEVIDREDRRKQRSRAKATDTIARAAPTPAPPPEGSELETLEDLQAIREAIASDSTPTDDAANGESHG
jgi:hypothetical protein